MPINCAKSKSAVKRLNDVSKSRSEHDCLTGVNGKLLFNGVVPQSASEQNNLRAFQTPKVPYRSVAFKTWTVGSARKILNNKSLNVNGIGVNGFMSDSDSNFGDEVGPSQVTDVFVPRKCCSSEIVRIPHMMTRSRDNVGPTERNSGGSANIDDDVYHSSWHRRDGPVRHVRFDGSTNVDEEFHAVIDTIKDLQNFISSLNVPRSDVNHRHSYTRMSNNPTSNEGEKNSNSLFTSFISVDQALVHIKKELNNLRRDDFALLKQLLDIRNKIYSNEKQGCLLNESNNSTCDNKECHLPPIPFCLTN